MYVFMELDTHLKNSVQINRTAMIKVLFPFNYMLCTHRKISWSLDKAHIVS